jgi:hypothetical protein
LYRSDKSILSKGITDSGEVLSYEKGVIDGKPIDIMAEANTLAINLDVGLYGSNYDVNKESVRKIIEENIKSIKVVILVNNIHFYTHEIPVKETQCNYEAIRFDDTTSSLKCNIKSDVSTIYKNTEVVRAMYRSRLNSDTQLPK